MASLFHTADIPEYSKPQHRQASVTEAVNKGPVHNLLMRANETLAECWPVLAPGQHIHYATAGLWSSHDLLFHLLKQTGPARVTIATWSMTEEPVRMLIQGLETGIIRELNTLLDIRVKTRNASVFHFARYNFAKVAESICHAKVTIIENDHWAISLVGSPNYTNNPRIECGIMLDDRAVAAFHRGWIDAEINKAKPFGDHASDHKTKH